MIDQDLRAVRIHIDAHIFPQQFFRVQLIRRHGRVAFHGIKMTEQKVKIRKFFQIIDRSRCHRFCGGRLRFLAGQFDLLLQLFLLSCRFLFHCLLVFRLGQRFHIVSLAVLIRLIFVMNASGYQHLVSSRTLQSVHWYRAVLQTV